MKPVWTVAVAGLLLTGCATQPAPRAGPAASPTPPSLSPAASPAAPAFHGSAATIDEATASRMRASWRAGCPVGLGDLRLLSIDHWGFDGVVHRGEIVVHRERAAAVLGVFRALFDARFPIERMRLVDEYGGDDLRSMDANNTSGFNCRRSTGSPDRWSEHSYGAAIDINPIQNPYVTRSEVLPPAGRAFTDRTRKAPGMIRAGDAVVRAFAAIGWTWGGDYRNVKDYQHFSAGGT